MRTALAALALALCAALGACDPAADYNTIPAAEDAVRGHLRDPGSAEFSDVTAFPQADHPGKSIVCGNVNSHNGFGGMAGRERFLVAGNDSWSAGRWSSLRSSPGPS